MLTTSMPSLLLFCVTCVEGEEKVWVVPPLALQEASNLQVLAPLCCQIPHLSSTLKHRNSPGQFPLLAVSSHFRPAGEVCPAFPTDLNYGDITLFFFTLSLCAGHDQHGHQNQTLEGIHLPLQTTRTEGITENIRLRQENEIGGEPKKKA